jgi:hypothetical protein
LAGATAACGGGGERPSTVSAGHIRGAIVAFDRNSCPAGWDRYVGLQGRTIVGVNPGPAGGQGENGLPAYDLARDYGQPTVTLQVDQLPAHRHGHGDIYHSESFPRGQPGYGSGADGTLSVPAGYGSARSDTDNVGNQVVRQTGDTGGGRPVPLQPPARAFLYCKLL